MEERGLSASVKAYETHPLALKKGKIKAAEHCAPVAVRKTYSLKLDQCIAIIHSVIPIAHTPTDIATEKNMSSRDTLYCVRQ